MKITIQDEGRKVKIETQETEVKRVLDEICNLLIAYGFHPESVKDGIFSKAEDYESDQYKHNIIAGLCDLV